MDKTLENVINATYDTIPGYRCYYVNPGMQYALAERLSDHQRGFLWLWDLAFTEES